MNNAPSYRATAFGGEGKERGEGKAPRARKSCKRKESGRGRRVRDERPC